MKANALPCCNGLVSTIIPAFNRPTMLQEAVHSVLAQTYRPLEIIIVDDGSTDATGAVADCLAKQHPTEITTLHTPNRGVGQSREAGRLLARGEFIQYLDSDDLLRPQKFEWQVAALRQHPGCGVAYGRTRLISEQGQILEDPYKGTGHVFETLFPQLLVDRWWNTHTPLYRRSVSDAVGPWSTMRIAEDWEYDARVGSLNTRLTYCDGLVSEHRCHAGARLSCDGVSPAYIHDYTQLIQRLLYYAKLAGVPIPSQEMTHLARWAFLVARRAGMLGLSASADTCSAVALQAAAGGPPVIQVLLARWLAAALGWRRCSILLNSLRKC
ncbi:glycosyltransferase family A protein [uncultured Thiodictyon sp.]|uniref:glycosyltransferase family 2 protein n=1 Tax=uncultured Thiodictyon sp. TaxID=1846217 RepID=UPI00342B851E